MAPPAATVLPVIVEKPIPPPFMLDTEMVDSVTVLPVMVENPNTLVYKVEPVTDDITAVS